MAQDISDCEEEVGDGKLPKHMRARYWDSREQYHLIKLWRLHANEITTLKENGPGFRKIAYDMRRIGIHVNTQECRRKITSLFHTYKVELRKSQFTGEESSWRYFLLIDSVLNPIPSEPAIKLKYKPPLVRTSLIMRDTFTVQGMEMIRKKNQHLLLDQQITLRKYKIRKLRNRNMKRAVESWICLIKVLQKQLREGHQHIIHD